MSRAPNATINHFCAVLVLIKIVVSLWPVFLRSSFVSVIPFKVVVDQSEYFFGTEWKDAMQVSCGIFATNVKPLVDGHQQSLLQGTNPIVLLEILYF